MRASSTGQAMHRANSPGPRSTVSGFSSPTLVDEKIAKKQARFNDLKDDVKLRVLHTEIAKIYIGLKQKTRDSAELSAEQSMLSEAEANQKKRLTSQNEREIIMQLDFFVLIEYIKSAIDIIL